MKRFFLFLTSLTLLTAPPAMAAYDLTILHTNDFHARFEPISRFDSGCGAEDNLEGKCFGGTARLITAIQDARERAGNSLLLDGGINFKAPFTTPIIKAKSRQK